MMVTIGQVPVALDDPRLWAAAVALLLFLVLLRAVRARRGRSSRWRGTSPTSTARSGR